jgi:hypothetical protein
MYPHRIRLRGPWECEPLARLGDDAPPPPPLRMTMPCHWNEGGLAGFAGRARFRRRFGYPGRIDAHERVWLTFAEVAGAAEVRLNGAFLGSREPDGLPFEFEVTALLRQRNELVVDVESATERGGLSGEVALEVRCSAFLRGVRVEPAGCDLHVRGEVVGTAEGLLELYVVLNRSTVAYEPTAASPEGHPFHLVAAGVLNASPGGEPRRVGAAHRSLGGLRPPYEDPNERTAAGGPEQFIKVDLVNGATVWYTFVQGLAPSPAREPAG